MSLEEQFQKACEVGDIPGVVLIASGANGFRYKKAFGLKSPGERLEVDATFVMASCTKLMTSIAALQCVERGQIGLDDDLSTVVPEFKDIQILTGFKESTQEPVFKTAVNKITLRHLLTHTSGIAYEAMDPLLGQWHKSRGEDASQEGDPLVKKITVPLLFEPGTGWVYGYSLDWAGLVVMRLNKMFLEEYMQKYIWRPLGIENITFHQDLKSEVVKNLVKMSTRGDSDLRGAARDTEDKVQWTDELLHMDTPGEEFGGQGAVGSAIDYVKILDSLRTDDGRLLMSETIDDMFTPQLGAETIQGFEAWADYIGVNKMFSSQEPGTRINVGLGGSLVLSDTSTGVKSGTLSWSGLPNLLWTIDRQSDLSLFYASNVCPFGDRKSHKMQQVFEKEMYSRAAKL